MTRFSCTASLLSDCYHQRRLCGYAATAALALVLIDVDSAVAQTDAELATMRTQLLGEKPRTWVRERVVLTMGSHSDCTSGETYRFKADDKVTIIRCVNRKLVRQSPEPVWTLTRLGPLDVQLKFEGRTYLLTFGGTSRAPQMRWQQLGSSKREGTEEIYLGLSKD